MAAWGGPGLRREVPAAARSLEPPPQKHHPKSFVLCHGDDDPWGLSSFPTLVALARETAGDPGVGVTGEGPGS